ncbi:MAG: methionyl-tRNA formyltransferase [Clostridia bacterium]|nr:methionyl-tRNA formyltransferase [Clostridia bacterium]MBQ5725229.1 methionyl-tRNA formyltransferase [Clostridia bacterium]
MRIIFMGTPDFAVPSLRALCETGEDVVAVITQPDKPRGRGYVLTPTPVKAYALERGIPVYQPETLRGGAFDDTLRTLAPDLIIVVAYGKILPLSVLSCPPLGCINVHGSLLPALRGAAPMQRAIMDGHPVTGVTTMYMAEGLDTGDMLLREEIEILTDDNFETIHDKLAEAGARTLLATLAALRDGTLVAIPQDNGAATYAAKIEKEDRLLDFSRDAEAVHNLIRGLSPIPLAFTHTPDGKLLKVPAARVARPAADGSLAAPGAVLSLEGGIEVACGRGSVLLTTVTPEGKSRMSAADYVRGRKLSLGDILA